MSPPRTFIIAVMLLFLLSAVHARDEPSITGRVTAVVSPAPTVVATADILPLPVRAERNASLRVMAATQLSTRNVFTRERDAYNQIRSRWVEAPAAERTALQPQVAEQRRRVLLASLNSVTAIYQRVDVIISSMETALLRLQLRNSQRSVPVEDFDSRFESIKNQLDVLRAESDQIAVEIESCQKGIDLSACVKSTRDRAAHLISLLRTYFIAYRTLAIDVI